MKKLMALLVAAVFIAVSAGCNQSANIENTTKSLTVYTSIYPMYDFTVKIGGDKVRVVNMMASGGDPHSWEPSANDMVNLEKADMFIYNGAGMEHWVDKVLTSLTNKRLVVVKASSGVGLLAGHQHGHEDKEHADEPDGDGDEHHEDEDEGFDPHVWLSLKNAKIQMENIKNALAGADPENAEYYNANYERYAAQLDVLDDEFTAALASVAGKTIVVTHQAFGYLCQDYGLMQLGIEGLSPYSEPTPAKMAEVIAFVRENNVTTIFFDAEANPGTAKTIANATGAKTATLWTIGYLTEKQTAQGSDYFSLMRENLTALQLALTQ